MPTTTDAEKIRYLEQIVDHLLSSTVYLDTTARAMAESYRAEVDEGETIFVREKK